MRVEVFGVKRADACNLEMHTHEPGGQMEQTSDKARTAER